MKVIDDALLQTFRDSPKCEWCKAANRGDIHPHHLVARGMGGGGRLDMAVNLIALCWRCHGMVHTGHIQQCDLVAVIAAREGFIQAGLVLETIWAYQRTPKPNLAAKRRKRA